MSDKPTAVQLLHPFWRDKEIARVAAAARAREPDPRLVLRQAHADRAAAREAADRLEAALERARTHHAEITAHYDDLFGAVEAETAESAAALIAELTEGLAGRSSPRQDGARRVALATAEAERTVAQRALDALSAQGEDARKKLARASRAVQEAAAALLIDAARREAEQLLADADALDRRRAALDALGIEVTNLQRSIGIMPGPGSRPWPEVIGTALHPELRSPPVLPSRFAGAAPEATRRWSAIAAALVDSPEAYLDMDTHDEDAELPVMAG